MEPSLKPKLPGSLIHDPHSSGRFYELLKVGPFFVNLCLPLPRHKALCPTLRKEERERERKGCRETSVGNSIHGLSANTETMLEQRLLQSPYSAPARETRALNAMSHTFSKPTTYRGSHWCYSHCIERELEALRDSLTCPRSLSR